MQKNKKEKLLPSHVGIVISGNSKWSEERNLPVREGDRKSCELIRECPQWFFDSGVKYLSLFAFSSDVWDRDQEEVSDLMKLLKKFLAAELEEEKEKKYRVLFCGRVEELPGDIPALISELEAKTKMNTEGTLQICLNYSGRNEVLDMIKKVFEKKLSEEQIHEGILRKYLYHGELPDLDIILCTSGQRKIPNFLTWQSIGSELMFSEKFWPDFEKNDAEKIVQEFNQRKQAK